MPLLSDNRIRLLLVPCTITSFCWTTCVLCTKCTFNRGKKKTSWKLVRRSCHWGSHHSCTTNWGPHTIPTYDRDYRHLLDPEIVVKSYHEIPNSIHFDRVAKDHTNADLGLECFGRFMLMLSDVLAVWFADVSKISVVPVSKAKAV